MKIEGKTIGSGQPVYVIAEGGVAHYGSLAKAMALVDLAVDSGADAFKLQAYRTDRLIAQTLPDWVARMKSKEVGLEFLKQVSNHCRARGITFLCTPHEASVLPWLETLGVPVYKVGSGERGNTPFLREISRLGKPVILSTGTHAEAHVRAAVEMVHVQGKVDLALLHCVTAYPVPTAQANLRVMDRLNEMFDLPVGYSDHTQGTHACLAAVARGAAIIEKHIALDFNVPNAQDWKVACGPDTFPQLVRDIRRIELMLGQPELRELDCESPALEWALKSVVAAKDLSEGEPLAASDLAVKRPGGGMPPDTLDSLLGRRLKSGKQKDELILNSDLWD